jgi:hypothetical protein
MSAISVEPPFAKQDNIGWTYAPVIITSGATASGSGVIVAQQAVPAGVWAVSSSIQLNATAGQLITRTSVFLQAVAGVNYIFTNADGNTGSSNGSLTTVITLREPATLTIVAAADTDAGTYQVIGGGASSIVYITRIA